MIEGIARGGGSELATRLRHALRRTRQGATGSTRGGAGHHPRRRRNPAPGPAGRTRPRLGGHPRLRRHRRSHRRGVGLRQSGSAARGIAPVRRHAGRAYRILPTGRAWRRPSARWTPRGRPDRRTAHRGPVVPRDARKPGGRRAHAGVPRQRWPDPRGRGRSTPDSRSIARGRRCRDWPPRRVRGSRSGRQPR